jgi:hypothetical protein
VEQEETMARPAPKTKNWKAEVLINPGGGGYRLVVRGEVEVANTNETPHLAEQHPQGINPKILLLDLTITSHGEGKPVMTWKEVRFEKKVTSDQYTSVDILWEGKSIADIKVTTPKS